MGPPAARRAADRREVDIVLIRSTATPELEREIS